jgi:hypothetical protein
LPSRTRTPQIANRKDQNLQENEQQNLNMQQFLHETCNSFASKQAFITQSSTPRCIYYSVTQKGTITTTTMQRSSITTASTVTPQPPRGSGLLPLAAL